MPGVVPTRSDFEALSTVHANVELLREEAKRREGYRVKSLYPDEGPMRRALYWWSIAFWLAGNVYLERLIMAANQIGKTLTAGCELTWHMTGDYPVWWQGKRYAAPNDWWIAGDTMLTTRDILQVTLLGGIDGLDTHEFNGLIPAHRIYDFTRRSGGVSKCAETVWVRWGRDTHHGAPMVSKMEFKSYDQGRRTFQGVPVNGGIWLDEEPPDPTEAKSGAEVSGASDIYSECLTRTVATDGCLMSTFTPLRGLTPFVKLYLETSDLALRDGSMAPGVRVLRDLGEELSPDGIAAEKAAKRSRFIVGATWEDAPHLKPERREALKNSYQPYQRDARTKGIPQLGAGAIYPFPEEDLKVAPFKLPRHWRRWYSLDTDQGAGWTAIGFYAEDPDTGMVVRHDGYKTRSREIAVHVDAIRRRGAWLKGVGDAAGLRVSEYDSEQTILIYRNAGCDLELADKAVESGIQDVYDLMTAGLFKVFATCQEWFDEWRLYRRNERGHIIKQNDHCMDETRYSIRSGRRRGQVEPLAEVVAAAEAASNDPLAWMAV